MYRTINLLIVDDHPLFRQGVRWSLNEEQDIKVIGDAQNHHTPQEQRHA